MMAKVMKELALAGYLSGTRGAAGGYQLAADPGRVTLGEILKTVDGPMSIVECSGGASSSCPAMSACRMHRMMGVVQHEIQNLVNGISLKELITERNYKK